MRSDELCLKDIIKAMNKISQYIEGLTEDQFREKEIVIDAVLRNIEIIGEAANKVSEEIYEEYDEIPWKRMIGLRNIVIHEYFGVDLDIVYKIITVNLPETQPMIEKIVKDIN